MKFNTLIRLILLILLALLLMSMGTLYLFVEPITLVTIKTFLSKVLGVGCILIALAVVRGIMTSKTMSKYIK